MLADLFNDQRAFMRLAGQIIDKFDAKQSQLYLTLIEEEFHELKESVEKGDIVNSIKEACDLIVVTLGYLLSLGLRKAELAWIIVHKGNMDKVSGPSVEKRDDGKVVKSPEWKANHKQEIHNKLEELVNDGIR